MNLDAKFNGEIFRKNNPMVLACNRQLAQIFPIRMSYQSGGYPAGTVMARNTTSTYYQAYNNSASSGLDTAAGVLFFEVKAEDFAGTAITDTALNLCIFAGSVFKDLLTGYDANAKTDLNAREVIGSDAVTVVIF